MRASGDSRGDFAAELERIRRALGQTADLREVRDLRDKAEAVRIYAKSAGLGLEFQNRATEVRLSAERRAGEILQGMPLRGGDRKSASRNDTLLEKFGISQNESSRWQREASLPEEDFQQYVRQTIDQGAELTSRELLHLARVYARETGRRESLFRRLSATLRKLARQRSRFCCIHVIPPWPEGRTSKANISRLMQQLVNLPVQPVVANRAHLHLWTPPEMLEDGLRLVRAWGFHFRGIAGADEASRGPRLLLAAGPRCPAAWRAGRVGVPGQLPAELV